KGVGQMAGQTGRNRYVGVSVSENGVLAYHPSATLPIRRLVWVHRDGHEEPLAAEPRLYTSPRLSPDGKRLAVDINDSGNVDVWIYDLARKTPSRLTFDPARDWFPLWTSDGQRVVFRSARDGGQNNLFWKAADGTGPVKRLTTNPNGQYPQSFSPDGKQLVFAEWSHDASNAIGNFEFDRVIRYRRKGSG
ncbi:MAG: TolB family protein, partial [Acidobacteriota bacterium]